MEQKYSRLLKNTAIFTIGSFGSKVLSFLIVPLYTYVLTTAEYGKIDLFATANSLMLPFTTLLIQEALIRFLPAGETNKESAANSCMCVFLFGIVLTFLGYPIYKNVFNFSGYIAIYIADMILSSYTTIFSQYLKASGDSVSFTLSGLVQTALFLALNLLFLLGFKLGMRGYFYSMLISGAVTACFISFRSHIFRYIHWENLNLDELKSMLKYSIPLIPNSLMWWIMNAGDKVIIYHFLGESANGIYSLAFKIPSILSMMYGVFMQAWQLSAIEEHNKSGQCEFYSKVFSMVSALLFVLTSCIIAAAKPLFTFIFHDDFIVSWQYVGILSLANIINCFSRFSGVVYTLDKKSIKAFYTTIMGAALNLLMNVLFISKLKLFGVAVATVLGYLAVFLIRMRDMHREFHVNFHMPCLFSSILLLTLQIVLSLRLSSAAYYISEVIILLLIVFINRRPALAVLKALKRKIRPDSNI